MASQAVQISETTFAAIDFEAAGAIPGEAPDAPIQIGIAVGRLGEEPEFFESYLAIGRPVTPGATRVHGITDEHLQGAPTLPELYPTLAKVLGDRPLVAHAHGTEKRFLGSLPGHSFGPWVDTLKLGRKVYPQAPSHKLGRLCDSLLITPLLQEHIPARDWHDALYDAAASLFLLFHVVRELGLEAKSPSLLLS
ncbi:MAG: 3'-5' exonuclease [Verrucomicrobiota bacterium JB023]|nr:3'-5' exonuclease [Verrucomicrobiota bacterium JB023]